MTSDFGTHKRSGLAVLGDTIVAPDAAFAALKVHPVWGWAFLCTCVLGMIGGYLQVPAAEHAAVYIFAHDPRFATMPAEQVRSTEKLAIGLQHVIWLLWPIFVIIGIAFAALVLLVGNALGKGSATFAKLFGLTASVGFIHFGLGYLLIGVIVAVRGGDAYQTAGDLLGALPNLGMLAPGAPTGLHAFLTYFSVTQIWSTVLLGLGFRAIADVKPAIAWAFPITIALCGALYVAVTLR